MKRAWLLAFLACSPSTPVPADADTNAEWKVVIEHLDGTLLSMWGTGPKDIWTVGGPRGNAGFKSLVLHFDGTAWKRLDPGGTDTYWWVHGTGTNDVWMVGENGRITHWDGSAFKETPSTTTATLFSVWAASPNDAWAVGGTPGGGTNQPNDVLLHWDGASWQPSPIAKPAGRTFFKVWGTGSDNLYVVGEAGTIWHRKGTTWSAEPNPAHGTLLTVHGCSANEVYAVGGRDVLRSDGTTWTALSPTLTNDVNGVSCRAAGEVVIVGSGGSKQRLANGIWQDDFGTVPYSDLHGAWSEASGEGSYWGVGGEFVSNPQPNVSRQGVIARFGKGSVPSTLLP
jgi:hypothetical protein